jgi:hypothetical protein
VLPDRDILAIRKWCDARVPPDARGQLRVEPDVGSTAVTIVERRPPWRPELASGGWSSTAVARLRYTATRGLWTLQCADAEGRWHRYDSIGPTPSVATLLAEIDRDPTGIFWG